MSVNLTINGVAYPFPVQGDSPPWGTQVTAWATAVTGGMLQKAGGTFTLTADVDFGATYGLKAAKFSTRSANPASSGLLRLANNEAGPTWRDSANSSDLVLKVNASDQLEFNGVPIGGATAYTANRAIVSNGSGQLTASATTDTEIGYVSGVTSAIQTQLDGKQATGNYITALTGDVTATGPGSVAATIANNAVTAAKMANGTITTTQISGTAGITGSQLANDTITDTQINSSAAIAVSKLAALTASRAVATDVSGFVSATSVTSTELGYVSGVTSSIQDQIDAKLDTATAASTYVPLTSGNYTLSRSAGRITVGNSNVETDLLSFTLAAGALATNRAVRVKLFGRWSHGGNPARIGMLRLKYGSTTVAVVTMTAASLVSNKPADIEVELRGNNSANAQIGNIVMFADNNSTFYTQSYGTASENSANALTLAVTFQWVTAATTETISLASEATLI